MDQHDNEEMMALVSDLLWFRYHSVSLNFPPRKGALDVGLESGRELLLHLVVITQTVTFNHCRLIVIREEWREPLDIVVWLLKKLGDGDRVM